MVRLSTQNITANTARPTTTEMSRYFSTAASPNSREPRKATGRGRGMAWAPQMTLISSTPTIIPPMVIMICFRGWP